MKIKKLEESDIEAVCRVHLSAFDSYHFSSYFTTPMLYDYFRLLMKYHHINIGVFDEDNRLHGFLISGNGYKKALKHFIKIHRAAILKIILLHPSFLKEKITEYFYEKMNPLPEDIEIIFLVAVVSDSKYKGIGVFIYKSFEEILLDRGIHQYGGFVRKTNVNGIRFFTEKIKMIRTAENYKTLFLTKTI